MHGIKINHYFDLVQRRRRDTVTQANNKQRTKQPHHCNLIMETPRNNATATTTALQQSSAPTCIINESREFQLVVHCKGIASAYETDSGMFTFKNCSSATSSASSEHNNSPYSFSSAQVNTIIQEVKQLNEHLEQEMPNVNYLTIGLAMSCFTCCLSMLPFCVKTYTVRSLLQSVLPLCD